MIICTVVLISLVALQRRPVGKRFEFHGLRHVQLPNWFIYYYRWIYLDLYWLVTVLAVLATAVLPAFHPRRVASAVLLDTFGLFASAEHLRLGLVHPRPDSLLVFGSYALFAAESLLAKFFLSLKTGAVLIVAVNVAGASVVYFLFLFERHAVATWLSSKFEHCLERVESFLLLSRWLVRNDLVVARTLLR